MSPRSAEALRAGIKALSSNPRRAGEVLRMATDDDPGMADAWLGRLAAGEDTLPVRAALARASARLGHDLRGLGFEPRALGVGFDVGYVRWDVHDALTARLAYAAALSTAREFDAASAELDALDQSSVLVRFTRAQLMDDTERWPDVLSAVSGCAGWPGQPYLVRAASLLEGKAAARLGLFDRAAAAAERATADSLTDDDVIVRDALFLRALVHRAQGEQDAARRILSDVAGRWPHFADAGEALADATYGLHVVDHTTIDSRTDRWDPATQTTPQQRAAAEQADNARQRMAHGEETLAGMVGLDGVKKQIASLKASTIARVLRQRKGIPTAAASRHMLMVGPPGVGKTESSRAIAQIFCGLGILPRPDVLETKKTNLAGQYVGEVEVKTREFLESAIGATVFFDEFGDLIHGGYAHGDPIGQAIIGELVPWMENNREDAILIAAGYPKACEKVLGVNAGLRGRFSTIITFDSYTPDTLVRIAEVIVARSGDTVEPGALEAVLTAPFARFYDEHHLTEDGDVVRTIDTLNNGRFVRNVVEKAQGVRDERIIGDFGLHDIDLSDAAAGADVPIEAISLLTKDDVAEGLRDALPPGLRG